MSSSAQYASIPKSGIVNISTANTNRDGTGTLGVVLTATATNQSGTRIDGIITQATATTTAGAIRFYITQGFPGATIQSITFSTTTATVTTIAAHGRTTGDRMTLQGAFPSDYNVTDVAITVLSSTTFTYTMATTPTLNAAVLGAYSTTPATPVNRLFREIVVPATVPAVSPYVAPFSNTQSSTSIADQGYLPIILQAGYSLRASTNNAESFNILAIRSGDLA